METQWHLTTAEVVFALLCMVLPWAFSDMPVIAKCGMLFVAWILLLHLGFVFIPFLASRLVTSKIAFAIGLTSLLIGLAFPALLKMWREEKAKAMSGVLHVYGATPNAQGRMFQIGRGGPCFNWQGAENQSPITFLDAAKFNLAVKNGELVVSLEVVDGQGKLVAKITDNHWEVSPDHLISWDKNYPDDTLEVLDGRGTVVLQVRLLADRVRIQGEWHDAFGNGTRIKEAPNGAADIFKLVGENNYPNDRVKPIMKYPSREHWGEFE